MTDASILSSPLAMLYPYADHSSWSSEGFFTSGSEGESPLISNISFISLRFCVVKEWY